MSKYSKGEWYACCLDAKPHFVFAGEGEKTVCNICHNDPKEPHYEPMMEIVTVEESVANAKLIQAAPELLTELKSIFEILNRLSDEMPREQFNWYTNKMYFKMDSIIKKATE